MTIPIERKASDKWRFRTIMLRALSSLRSPLLMALLPFVLFLPVTLGQQAFFEHDIQLYFYPYHAVSATMLRAGELPLWNPYAFGGIPLLGDGQTAIFYPPNWLFFILPGALALNYAILLQFSIAGVGMYACARGFGLRGVAALIPALAFMFSGMLTARVVHLSIMSGVALIPLLALCADRAMSVGADQRTRWRWLVAAASAAALQVFAGHPQIPVYTACMLGLLSLVRGAEAWALRQRWQALLVPPLALIGVYVLGYALAAIQLVPWVELGLASPRAAGATFEFVMDTGARGSDWLLWLFPFVFGAQQRGLFADAPMSMVLAVRSWEHSAYVGLPTLALALVGFYAFAVQPRKLFRQPQSQEDRVALHRWFTLLFVILTIIIALLAGAGKYTPFGQVVYALPVVGKLRAVERFFALAAFGLPLLAGFGLQWLLAERSRQRINVALAAGGMLVATIGICVQVAGIPGMPAEKLLTLDRANALLPLLFALGTLVLLTALASKPTNRVVPWLLAALLFADIGIYAMSYNARTDASLYAYQPEVLDALNGDGQPFRKATVLLNSNALPNPAAQETLAVSWGIPFGVEDMNGFNSLQPRRYTDYVFGPEVGDVSYGYLPNQALLQPDSPILSSLNVRYILVPTGGPQPTLGSHLRQVFENVHVRVYENTQVWPRAYFAERVRNDPDPRAVLAAVTAPGFDGRTLALVESNALPQLAPTSSTAAASVTQEGPNALSIATKTSEPRLLVLSEMDFPGWKASIDGNETPIYKTNYLFRGVVVPPGEHTVRFVYQPLSAVVGAAISALAMLLAGWLLWRSRVRLTFEAIGNAILQ